MKFKKLALVGLLSIFTLTSCLTIRKAPRIKSDLTYTFTEEDEAELREQMKKFESAIKGNSTLSVATSWARINNIAYTVATIRTIENINYAKGDSEAYSKYTYFQELLFEIVKWQESQYQAMYDSAWKDDFFSDMTEEEIQALINSKKPDEYYELENKQDKLIKEYNDLTIDDSYNSKVDTIYKALVKNYQEEAKLLNYDTFLDCAYANEYSREYSVSDTASFDTYVKNYIVPLYYSLNDSLEEEKNKLTEEDKLELAKFDSRELMSYTYYDSIMEDYAKALGGKYLNNYNKIRRNGYIVTADANANIDAAFTTYLFAEPLKQPIIYFGPSYQNVMTFIHEFGHYNSFCVNGAGEMSYDLAETQSQGNELLFISYLQNEEYISKELCDYIASSQIVDALKTIIMATIINNFEKIIYQATRVDDIDSLDLDQTYHLAVESFSEYDKLMQTIYGDQFGKQVDYWRRVCISNAGYYISYAISLIPSLEIYAKAKKDFKDGLEAYTSVYNFSSDYTMADFIDVIEQAGLKSPFKEEAFTLIASINE